MKWIKLRINKVINKLVSFGFKRTFMLYESKDGEVKLVKVYSIYKKEDKNKAIDDMVDLAIHKKNEYEVLKKYDEES